MSQSKSTRRRRWPYAVLFVLMIGAVGGGATLLATARQTATPDHGLVHTVERSPLTISVSESGTVKARNRVTIRSQVEGRTTILSLIPEGTHVEEGDVLVELDASDLEERKLDQEISVENAESSLIQAQESLEVTRNQAQANIDQAELDHEFAQEDLDQYRDVEYPMELKEAENRVTLAEEDLELARDQFEGSQRLFDKRYISHAELERDRLAMERARLDHELAQEQLRMLQDHTRRRRIKELESAVEQTRMALERVRREARADVLQAEANERARESEYERQQSRLARLKRQIENCMITAPTDGMVVYSEQGRRWNPEPLVEGLEVRERQELMTLPTANSMNAEIRVHESARHKIDVGQRVRIRVDAVPNQTFVGRVASIGVMAEDGGRLNPDLREYKAEVEIEGEHENLNPGMSATAEILVARYDDALAVPVQSVLRVNGEPSVYIVDERGQLQRRAVEIGLDNNRMVHVTGGLNPGERVALSPPLDEGERHDFGPGLDGEEEEDVRTAMADDSDSTRRAAEEAQAAPRPQRGGEGRAGAAN